MLVFKVDNWIYDSRSGCCCVVFVVLFLFVDFVALFSFCCFVLKGSNRQNLSFFYKDREFPDTLLFFLHFYAEKRV